MTQGVWSKKGHFQGGVKGTKGSTMKKRVSVPIKDTKLFKEIASVITNGVVIVNSKGEIMFFNKAAENIFQIPTEKAIN